jgi:Kef-type K+ transport system membrane component KefB
MNFRRMEKRLNFKAIFTSLILNLLAAAGVFLATFFVTGDIIRAIFYTFVSWSITLSLSVGFWIWYLFRKVKADNKTKRNIAYFLIIMLATALILVWFVLSIF